MKKVIKNQIRTVDLSDMQKIEEALQRQDYRQTVKHIFRLIWKITKAFDNYDWYATTELIKFIHTNFPSNTSSGDSSATTYSYYS